MLPQTSIFNSATSLLLIKPRAIGDVLLSTPVIKNLKTQFPDIQIDFLCEQFAVDVLIGNPGIREIIPYNKKTDSMLSLIRKVRKKEYSIVIDLFGNPRTALLTFFSGAEHRIGFPFRGRAYAYSAHVPPRSGSIHNIDFNLDVLRAFGIDIDERKPDFPISDNHRNYVRDWLLEKGILDRKLIGINAGGGWYTKKWKAESFALLADRLAEEEHALPLLFWGPGERDEVKHIQSLMKKESVLLPKTSLKEMGAFAERCHCFISNDSGPMHIAASLGTPTLGIFGPTNPELQGPYGERSGWVRNETLDCLNCNLTSCPIGNVCMTELTVDGVLQAYHRVSSLKSESQ